MTQPSGQWVRRALLFASAAACAAFLLPYIAVGPNDLEEFYTGILSTKLAANAILAGHWPFWSTDLGLGVPLPLKYHFITHPLGLLCGVSDCHRMLRIVTSIQIALAVVSLRSILRAVGVGEVLSTCGALAYLVTSSTIQYTYVNDWSSTGVNEASIPILILAGIRMLEPARPRDQLLWSLVFGGVAGLISGMGYAVPQLLIVVPFLLARPQLLWAARRWFTLAFVITVAIGGGHLYHLAEQVLLTPPTALRGPHVDPSLTAQLWSTFMRPFGPALDRSWRISFLGPPFAALAVASVFRRAPQLWPFRVGLAGSVLLLVLPESALMNLVTARWFFSAGVNVYGILLATHFLDDLSRARILGRVAAPVAAGALVVLQFAWQGYAFWATWLPVARVAVGYPEQDPSSRRVAHERPAVEQLRQLTKNTPGRLMLSLDAHAAVRTLALTRNGLAPNIFAMYGVPTLDGLANGIVVDDLYPTPSLTGGPMLPPSMALEDRAFLDVLGVRYVLSLPDERRDPGLIDRGNVPGGLRLLENPTAWPEAFFVAGQPPDRVPRKQGCEHDRFLCADFSQHAISRLDEPIRMTRHPDGVTLTFTPAPDPRLVVLTHWYRKDWHASDSAVEVVPVAEQFIGLRIPAGRSTVTLTYFPVIRGTIFLAGVACEIAVAVLCIAIVVQRRRGAHEPA